MFFVYLFIPIIYNRVRNRLFQKTSKQKQLYILLNIYDRTDNLYEYGASIITPGFRINVQYLVEII